MTDGATTPLVLGLVGLLALGGCHRAQVQTRSEQTGPTSPDAGAPQKASTADAGPSQATPRPEHPADAAPDPEAPYRCAQDTDCITSCGLGAINAAWWRTQTGYRDDCQDGCAAKGMNARCESGSCVAYFGSKRHDDCTHRPLPPPSPDLPYRCERTEDCVLTCADGALNGAWYEAHRQQLQDCQDGCTSEGATVRCEAGSCTAYQAHGDGSVTPFEGCTRKPIEWRQ